MNITEALFHNRNLSVEPKWLADIYGRLIWLLNDDAGSEICQVLKSWLSGDNREKIAVALAFDEVYLFSDYNEMVSVFSNLIFRFPEFEVRCREIITMWESQGLKSSNH